MFEWTGRKALRCSCARFATNDIKAKSIVSGLPLEPKATLISFVTPDLTEAIDIYSEWIDAADAAQNEPPPRRPAASSSRAAPRAAALASDDD